MRGKTNAVPITTLTIAINVSPIVAAQLNVQVSKSPGGIHVQIEGNYLRAANNHLDHLYLAGGGKKYAADIPYQHQILSPKKLQPGQKWSFGASIGFTFPNSGNDIEVRYNQLKLDKKKGVTSLEGSKAT